MLDQRFRPLIDRPLNRAGALLAARGWAADGITLAGLACGLAAAALLAFGAPAGLALVPLAAGRIADGLDGAVARATGQGSDAGGYLDIFCDFVFYAAVPLAFALRDPAGNALAAATLLAAFYINAASFLGFAIFAAKRGLTTRAQGEKALYYAAGLIEGAETIAFFALLCLFPAAFVPLALVFAALCALTAVARLVLMRRRLAS